MPEKLMTDAEIVRALRELMAPRPIPVTQLAARCGLHRGEIYRARDGAMSDRVRSLLSQVLREGGF